MLSLSLAPMARAGCPDIVGASLVIHAWHAVSSAVYVDFVMVVWLTLATDLPVHGVFYRELVGADGCGVCVGPPASSCSLSC